MEKYVLFAIKEDHIFRIFDQFCMVKSQIITVKIWLLWVAQIRPNFYGNIRPNFHRNKPIFYGKLPMF